MSRKHVKLFFLTIFLVGLVSVLWLLFSQPSSQEYEIDQNYKVYQSYEVSQIMEEIFNKNFLVNTEANIGITIDLIYFYSHSTDTQVGELIEYSVLNHTNEYVVFPNRAFGLRVFTPNEDLHKWVEISPNIVFGDITTGLPPHTEASGTQTENLFFMLYSYYNPPLPEKLRFCVFGVGHITQKKYAACLDALRVK